MNIDGMSVLTPLRAHAEKHPDKLLFAFLDSECGATESYTYEAFLRRAADIASHLHRTQPLEPGERVLLVYPPGVEMICAFYHNRANTTLCGLAYGKPLFLLSRLNPPFDVLNGGPVGVRNKVGVGLLDDLGRVT